MSEVRLNGAGADHLEHVDLACQITEEKSREQIEKQRRSWCIISTFFSTESEDESFLEEHPLGRG